MHISDSVPSASGARELFSTLKHKNCISAGGNSAFTLI